jgi:Ca2+-binding EF-hand superfamily protein
MGNCCADDKGGVSQPGAHNKTLSNSKVEDAVNAIFEKYDKDKSGLLDKSELTDVINASLA